MQSRQKQDAAIQQQIQAQQAEITDSKESWIDSKHNSKGANRLIGMIS